MKMSFKSLDVDCILGQSIQKTMGENVPLGSCVPLSAGIFIPPSFLVG